MPRQTLTVRRAVLMLAAGLLALAPLGCEKKPQVTVAEVRANFAQGAVSGDGSSSPLGSITAERYDELTGQLVNVHVAMGDAFFLNAAFAELIVDADRDEMMIRFIDVAWTAPLSGDEAISAASGQSSLESSVQGRLFEAETRTTPPWNVGVDIIAGDAPIAPRAVVID